ncbi:MAG: N-acetylmuramoyl-L-alanine amidase [Arenicellales bacterium]
MLVSCFKSKAFSAALLVLILMQAQFASAAKLNDIRIWNAPERTRIVLDLDQVPKFKQFHLANPSRFVIDLPSTTLNTRAPKNKQGAFVSNVRLGVPKENIARVVLDLAQAVKIETKVFKPTAGYQHRLIIDVYPKNKAKAAQNSAVAKVASPKKATQSSASNTKRKPSAQANAQVNAKAKKKETLIIAIDAGHGGEDSGARGKRSKEKKVVLQVAKRLKRKIDAQKGMKAVLTRTGDYFIPLRTRTKKAREAGADIFISIHADGFKDRSARGSSVYALSLRGATSESARWLANKENSADLAGGVSISERADDVAKLLLDLSMGSTQHESISLAASVLKEFKKIGKVHNNKVEKAGFVVLKSPDIPSILVETAFITNRAEERLLNTAAHQEKLANAILVGAMTYLKKSSYHTARGQ